MGSSSQVSLEEGLTEQAVSARTLTPAMRRLDELRPLLDPILKREGIPLEIALVVVAESDVRADALSPKGARGLWQLMPETARRYGLVVEGERDERLDVEKSTRAAAQYLRDLRTQFKSWPLALAAYNAGEQTVQNAIARAGDNTFAVLRSRQLLPTETRDYVSAVINLIARSGSSNDFTEQVRRPRDQWIVYAVRE
jgi:membrane-bound lytic murein transglycosylase D